MAAIKHILCSMVVATVVVGCSGDNAEKTAAGAVSKVVELAKGATTGAGKGLDQGRKATTSADGAVIVSKGSELTAALTGEVLRATRSEAQTQVTLGFTNAGEAPVRVTELSVNNHVTALDEDGYACTTASTEPEFTVPAKAKLKVAMAFDCGDKAIAKVRLFETEYAVGADRIESAK